MAERRCGKEKREGGDTIEQGDDVVESCSVTCGLKRTRHMCWGSSKNEEPRPGGPF